jgi:hypothetical protein
MTRKRMAGIAIGLLACLPVKAAEVRIVRFDDGGRFQPAAMRGVCRMV